MFYEFPGLSRENQTARMTGLSGNMGSVSPEEYEANSDNRRLQTCRYRISRNCAVEFYSDDLQPFIQVYLIKRFFQAGQ